MEPLRRRLRGTFVHRLYRRVRPAPALPDYDRKRAILLAYAGRFGLRTLIETGTCLGDTAEALQGHFDRVVTVELDRTLAAQAADRLGRFPHVSVVQGDSGEVLGRLVPSLTAPALFWLDAHYSWPFVRSDTGEEVTMARGASDTPLAGELQTILDRSPLDHVVLIDDARDLGTGDYPTLAELRAAVRAHRPGWTCTVAEDIVRIHPGR